MPHDRVCLSPASKKCDMKSQILLLLIFFSASNLIAQDKPDLQKLKPKRFIDKVEIIGGPSSHTGVPT
jgi:hypothetical protein